MLYLDYSRREGEWLPNQHGGRENLEAVEFLKQLNIVTHGRLPGTITVAEESTSWPAVSRPTFDGGLGFTYKWNMGWMHDMLAYMREDPVHRRWHHGQITFSMLYAFTENFVLPFSHDEVVLRQAVDAREDAGRPVAEARVAARALRVPLRPSRQEADVHGRRVRAAPRVEPRHEPGLGRARAADAPGAAALGARPQPRSTAASRRSTKWTSTARGFALDRLPRRRPQRGVAGAPGARPGGVHRGGRRTSRRCRAPATWWACPRPAGIARC